MKHYLSIALFFCTLSAQGKDCAKNYSELGKTERLKAMRSVLPKKGRLGFVNKTQGSYFFIESTKTKFKVRFYTTGPFDLFTVNREGALEFCDNGKSLKVIGLGKEKRVMPVAAGLQFDNGGDRHSFQPGPMPDELKKMNKLDEKKPSKK